MVTKSDRSEQDSGANEERPETGFTRVGVRTDYVVFSVAAAAVLAIVVWGLVAPDNLNSVTGSVLGWLVTNIGWLFVLAASAFVLFSIYLAVSRFGDIPLGKDGEKPEFRTVSWIAMMFSAGMGIGLMFFGVAEPLAHYVTPPPGTDGGVGTAMATTMFHWGLHPWAMYAVVGLAIAYGSYRRGRKQLFSSAFIPLLGRKAEGPIGKVIDILAIFATLFGTAASLGLGALQIGSGFEVVGWMEEAGVFLLVAIVAVLTLAFVASAVSGVAKGIQWLSNINMVLALILALFVFVLGPTVLILNLLPTTIGAYVSDLAQMSARTVHRRILKPARGFRRGRSSTGHGGCPGRRSSACSWPASAAAARSASSSSASSPFPRLSACSGSRSSAAQASVRNATESACPAEARKRLNCSACSTICRWPE